MFLEFYGLREQPFGVTPDPRYFYLSAGHREALASLVYGIETGRGFLTLIAEPGMGKTSVLFELLRWKSDLQSAFLFQTQCDSRELLRYLLEDFGLPNHDRDIVKMHSQLNDFLYRETSAGKQIIVFIDEAQNLSNSVLETVRLLSDFEAPDKKLLQIVLAGQPKLARRLSHPGLAQLRQRVSIQARLEPLTAGEVAGYVNHRLQVAGYRGPGLFTPGALALVAERSAGIPRIINNLCFHALSIGFAAGTERVTVEAVREACGELSQHFSAAKPPIGRPAARVRAGIRERLASFWPAIGDRVFRRRILQTLVPSLMLASVAMYIGANSAARTHQTTNASQEVLRASASQGLTSVASPSAFQGLTSVASPSIPDRSFGTPPLASQTRDPDKSVSSFTYIVQPKDTLRELCVSTMGRYDRSAIAQIRKLNPGLTNPNHLEVGQEIRFPLSGGEKNGATR